MIHTVLITAKNHSRLKYNYNIKEIQISFIIIKETSDKKKSVFHSIISRLCCIQFYLTLVREKKAANNPKYIQTASKKFFYYIKSKKRVFKLFKCIRNCVCVCMRMCTFMCECASNIPKLTSIFQKLKNGYPINICCFHSPLFKIESITC